MGLLDGLYKENYKYINALEALDMLAKDERCDVSKIAEFLLVYEFHKCSETYKKNYINQIVPCDDKAVGIISVDYWAVTNDILEKALENFVYRGNTYSEAYEESDYALYFWLKEDFYNFEGFKKVNFEINDETYEKYLTFKKLDEYEGKGVIEQKNKPINLDCIKEVDLIFPTTEQIDTIEPYQNKIDSLIKENEQLQMEIESLKPPYCSVYDHKFFLYKQPLYTINDCACIASGYDPLEIQKLPVEEIDEIAPDYVMALNLISSAVEAGQLNCFNYKINASDLSEYLQNQNIIIAGFSSQSVPVIQNETTIEKNTEQLLYLNDTLTIDEAACILSGDNPSDIKYALDNEKILGYKNFLNAQRLVKSAIQLGNLAIYSDIGIATHEFKAFLMMKNLTVEGFNDNEIDQEGPINLLADKMAGQSVYISQLENRIEMHESMPQADNEQLKLELAKANEQIKQLEAIQQIEPLEQNELSGLAKRNQLAQDRQGMARIIATSFWEDDQNILISDMANKVYAAMVDYCKEQLPQQPETIKNWIRPVAPKEAQRRGRQPKKSST